MHLRTLSGTAMAVASITLAAGCSSGHATATAGSTAAAVSSASSSSAAGSTAVSGTVTVFAAASLTGAFTALAKLFEAANPGVRVQLNFGASSTLAQQINQGAPADVFASASPTNMKQVIAAGGASASMNFVKNVMELAVPPSNPAHVRGVNDLARSGVKVALCQPQVPCGAVAAKVFSNATITVRPVTLEQDVKATLTKVELNEVDAGVVYVTDVRAAGSKVKGIPIPASINASTEYPIAALSKAPNSAGAQAFVAFVLSTAGQGVLTADGFERP
ncbi:MAG TPA: molybdate ABC transporter substrate-binding protein [Mycobacteriales bacterium]|jgi:molybdate transport system substrate-binding protein|nr:molybdate ABC transporter substrate-binding protein [Mycobacteriales bacterium]